MGFDGTDIKKSMFLIWCQILCQHSFGWSNQMCKFIAWIVHDSAQSVTIRWQFLEFMIEKDEGAVETNYSKQGYYKWAYNPSFLLLSQLQTLVNEGRSYHGNRRLGLSGACDVFFLMWNTFTARKKGGWLHPPGYEETRERTHIYIHIFTYTQTDGTQGANRD